MELTAIQRTMQIALIIEGPFAGIGLVTVLVGVVLLAMRVLSG